MSQILKDMGKGEEAAEKKAEAEQLRSTITTFPYHTSITAEAFDTSITAEAYDTSINAEAFDTLVPYFLR